MKNALKTHCLRGHEFNDNNTLLSKSGKRSCRACKNARKVSGALPQIPESERFWLMVSKQASCWLWQGAVVGKGYGSFTSSVALTAHRYSYYLANGALPKDKDVLHSCDNPRCVNPAHLSLGTNQDNINDKMAKGRWANGNIAKTHCKRGHEFTPENTRFETERNRRVCRLCDRVGGRRKLGRKTNTGTK